MAGLQARNRLPEWMDQPGLAKSEHHAALRGLGRVNWLTRSCNMIWPSLEALARSIAHKHGRSVTDQPLRVLDIASGGGDVTRAIAVRAARRGIPMEIQGCDISPVAVDFAQRPTHHDIGKKVDFFVHDILTEPLPDTYDAVVCSLFLHHLKRDAAIMLLNRLAAASQYGVFISDLRRSRLGYALACVGTRLLTRSRIVHYDGPQSVAGAFTAEEALLLSREAGWTDATLHYQFPQRFLLSWIKDNVIRNPATPPTGQQL